LREKEILHLIRIIERLSERLDAAEGGKA
jgi:hypothetical protein